MLPSWGLVTYDLLFIQKRLTYLLRYSVRSQVGTHSIQASRESTRFATQVIEERGLPIPRIEIPIVSLVDSLLVRCATFPNPGSRKRKALVQVAELVMRTNGIGEARRRQMLHNHKSSPPPSGPASFFLLSSPCLVQAVRHVLRIRALFSPTKVASSSLDGME